MQLLKPVKLVRTSHTENQSGKPVYYQGYRCQTSLANNTCNFETSLANQCITRVTMVTMVTSVKLHMSLVRKFLKQPQIKIGGHLYGSRLVTCGSLM